ncbi:MAG TPA: hypothetical protein VHM26_01670 [Chitinophagaceae bacterium]|jgi:capsular polysaccharide biosynthesis protein|nr:hypothetical protein [Chitinophagaceae bacterium]
MPDIFTLISKWWKHLLAITLLSMLVAGLANFFQPKKYLSIATALPANTYLSDKASVFNDNIQGLYSIMGGVDDLDKIIGTGQLDTIYLSVIDQFNIIDHYKLKKEDEEARSKCVEKLRSNTKINKSEYGELKVKVWDKDKNIAPQLANALLDKLQEIHSDLLNTNNKALLDAIIKKRTALMADSVSGAGEKLKQYDKLINEYQLMAEAGPTALLIVERARISQEAEKPKMSTVLFAAGFFGLLFGLFAVLVLDKRKPTAK